LEKQRKLIKQNEKYGMGKTDYEKRLNELYKEQ